MSSNWILKNGFRLTPLGDALIPFEFGSPTKGKLILEIGLRWFKNMLLFLDKFVLTTCFHSKVGRT